MRENYISFVILPLKFVTGPVVKKVSEPGSVYNSTSATIKIPLYFKSHTKWSLVKGHTRGISGSVRRKTGSLRPTFSLRFHQSTCTEFVRAFNDGFLLNALKTLFRLSTVL